MRAAGTTPGPTRAAVELALRLAAVGAEAAAVARRPCRALGAFGAGDRATIVLGLAEDFRPIVRLTVASRPLIAIAALLQRRVAALAVAILRA